MLKYALIIVGGLMLYAWWQNSRTYVQASQAPLGG